MTEVNPELLTALLEKEDKWFYYHPGVNPVALFRAFFSNLVSGKRVSGASTITMQVARMLEPKGRTYLNKIKEVFRAFQLELHYSKTEIMEMYLSYLPFGGNIEGVKAASLIYFDRLPQKLSLAQVVLLTVIPNRPNSLRLDIYPEEARKMRDKWLKKFRIEGVFPENQLDHALEEPISASRHEIEILAPHLSHRLLSAYPPGTPEIQTYLNTDIQITVENLLENHVRRVKSKGVSNGSVLVVDNLSAEVVGYAGSSDFEDSESKGQVNGIHAVRSPGSTLKPSLYALAFDKGQLTPKSVVADIPTNFGGYSPENYDLTFRGEVTVEYALRHSLNIPAVSTLRLVGLNDYLDVMGRAGMESIRSRKETLGLSVILGGCGSSLEELVRLFSCFARQGQMYPLRYTTFQAEANPEYLYSPESSYMMAQILSGIERPDIPNDFAGYADKTRIAWKTGTSFGKRDAWAIGFTPRFTIGVWMGNFDGHGAPDLSGSVMAVPLLFDLFNAIDAGGTEAWFQVPSGLYERNVCLHTGKVPGNFCTQFTKDNYINKTSHQDRCKLEQQVYISADSSLMFCTDCLPDSGYQKAVYPFYEPELCLWFENQKVNYQRPPQHNPACETFRSGTGPRIISPGIGFEYYLEENKKQEIMLQAASDARVREQHWFVNGKYFGKCEPGGKLFFIPVKGPNTVACMDDLGRESKLTVEVKFY